MIFTDKIKKYGFLVVITAIFLAGAFLHFRNLNGVIYLDEDEARAFGLLNSGPLIYLMCHHIFLLFQHSQKYVFYFAGLLGLISVFLFYLVCGQLGFGKRQTAAAVLFYAISPLRINYARTLYPAVFIEFYFLLALFFAVLALYKKQPWFTALCGFFCACIFFTHYFGYAIILGILAFSVSWLIVNKKELRGIAIAGFFTSFIAGFMSGYVVLDAILIRIGDGYEYTQKMLSCREVELNYAKWVIETPLFLKDLFIRMTDSHAWAFISVITLYACAFFIIKMIRQKSPKMISLFSMYFAGTAAFLILSYLGFHSIKERHFVWLSSFFSLSAAVFFVGMHEKLKGPAKKAVLVCAALFIGALMFKSYQITEETFKITDIRSWLQENHIPKGQLLTSWWTVNFLGDGDATSEIPGYFKTKGDIKDSSLWYRDSPRFVILWRVLFEAYRRGLCRYMLTSGISARLSTGEDDIWLKKVRPMMSWMHPYSKFKNRPFYNRHNFFINLYDLNDVFSRANIEFVLKSDHGTGFNK